MVYYNDNDKKVCGWIRELIADGLIPAGDVDDRSILDIRPDDLKGYTQCHFFAGIGGWAYALRLAGWPDDKPVWSGSCPCQPFSVAGKGKGESDERHLWPVFRELIRACKPPVAIGEQVASKAGREWLAGVFFDLEGMGYQRAGADLCSAGVGSPNIRQRLWWLAYADSERRTRQHSLLREKEKWGGSCNFSQTSGGSNAYRLVNPIKPGLEGYSGNGDNRSESRRLREDEAGSASEAGEFSFWSDSAWHQCRDGKARRIPYDAQSIFQRMVDGVSEGMDIGGLTSSGFPLAPKIKGRTDLLRGYGNAINPYVAAEFIAASMEAMNYE